MPREFNFAELLRSSEPMRSFRDPRHAVLLQASVAARGAPPFTARVRNISESGLMAECRFRGSEGEPVEIAVRGHGDLAGRVAWVGAGRIGVLFDERIDLAWILRRPASDRSEITVPRPPARAWRPALHCA